MLHIGVICLKNLPFDVVLEDLIVGLICPSRGWIDKIITIEKVNDDILNLQLNKLLILIEVVLLEAFIK